MFRLDRFTKIFPVHFSGAPFEDPQDFLDRCPEVLRNIGIVETNRVDFAAFQITDSARRCWRDYILTRPAGSSARTWNQFSHLFLEKFIHVTLREEYCMLFERLQHGSMAVTQYETRFVDLACHATILLPTERERVRRFIDGLTNTIRLQITKKPRIDNSSQTAVDIARWIELVRAHERGSVSDKRPHHFGGFSGASSGGRALPVAHGASRDHGSYGSCSEQLAFSAHSVPISAPPLQSYYSGYSDHQGQSSFQQPQQPRGCFECGGIDHIRRYCPRLARSRSQQGFRAIAPAPVAPSPTQPARGRGQAAKGGGQAIRG
ncbi:uncharacterized protein [Nicotiana tomentosiformis]|uniref:uncharacterized protein n=1 Tax=Nicotiana tomentosiformis TaxID=4098 RepID=UPI00388CA4A9